MKIPTTWLRTGALLALGLVGTVSALAQTSILYGVTFFDNQLIRIDAATGAGTLVAQLSQPVSPYGLAFRGDRLYTFDADTDRVREINRTTGLVSGSFNIGVGNLIGEGDITFRSDGIGFLSSALTPNFGIANDLFRFDLTAGTSVRLGTTSVVLDGMVFLGNTLYAIGQESEAKLYIVNQSNGALTTVGLLGVVSDSPFGALTVGANGGLYGAINDRLYSISPVTGLASELKADVLDTGFASVSGLAFSPAPLLTAVPEPATYGLLGAAALMVVIGLRRKRARAQFVPASQMTS